MNKISENSFDNYDNKSKANIVKGKPLTLLENDEQKCKLIQILLINIKNLKYLKFTKTAIKRN